MGDAIEKPLDLGSGALAASFDATSAAWLSLGAPHPIHGFVELAATPPFDESLRGDPDATRRYRAELERPGAPFLAVEIDGAPPRLEADLGDPTTVRWSSPQIEVRAEGAPDDLAQVQHWRLAPGVGHVTLRLGGRLDRPALAEITETDPEPATRVTTALRPAGARALVEASGLPARVEVAVEGAATTWHARADVLVGRLDLGPDRAFTIIAGFGGGAPRADRLAGRPSGLGRVVDRALAYVRGCTMLRFGTDERVAITDHRLLPLSWTRDAYWQALALLAANEPGDHGRVADHLRWLWRRCERPDGRWVRSHHADGRRKDRPFQADQQLYPMLELADYWRATSALPDGVDWERELPIAWDAASAAIDSRTGLIATAETAADDPLTSPHVGATQILLWYVATRLAELAEASRVGLGADALRDAAREARDAFGRHHASAGAAPWAYAVDGRGGRTDYHDANDLPVALAPLWGFCEPTDPGWRATIAYAFSPANPGWSRGRLRSGLGSVHTPGPWTLGDIQAWIAARATENGDAASAALARLDEAAYRDGMLPEVYNPDGDERVRAWFAWPGAALASLRLLDDTRRLGTSLAPRRR